MGSRLTLMIRRARGPQSALTERTPKRFAGEARALVRHLLVGLNFPSTVDSPPQGETNSAVWTFDRKLSFPTPDNPPLSGIYETTGIPDQYSANARLPSMTRNRSKARLCSCETRPLVTPSWDAISTKGTWWK